MAGLGRRSHYRKHLTDAVLHDLVLPQDNERIAQVVATRGGNQFDVRVMGSANNDTLSSSSQSSSVSPSQLALLPNKFHKLIWLKRGDYVIVQTISTNDNDNDDNASSTTVTTGNHNAKGGSGIRYLITHILYKDQIKHLKQQGLWPADDLDTMVVYGDNNDDDDAPAAPTRTNNGIVHDQQKDTVDSSNSNIEYDIDLMMTVNTNRIHALQIQDSSASSSSEDDSGSSSSRDDQDDDDKETDVEQQQQQLQDGTGTVEHKMDDGIVYDTGDDDLFATTNRVTTLRIPEDDESSSSSSSSDNHEHDNNDDDRLVYDAANHQATTSLQPSYSLSDAEQGSWRDDDDSDSDDNAIQKQETNDSGIEYDTGNIDKQKRTRLVTSCSLHDGNMMTTNNADDSETDYDNDEEDGKLRLAETSDSVEYDTGKRNFKGLEQQTSGTNQGGNSMLCHAQTSDSVEYDTGNVLQDEDGQVKDLGCETSREEEEDDSMLCHAQTNDSVEYDTGNILQDEEEQVIDLGCETSREDDEDGCGVGEDASNDLVYDTQRGANGLVVGSPESDSDDDEADDRGGVENQEEEHGVV